MRSRPALTVQLKSQSARVGQRVSFEIVLEGHTDTPIDEVRLVLTGVESQVRGSGKSKRTLKNAFLEHRDVIAGFALGAGERRGFDVSFDLPADALPSYSSDVSEIAYSLSVNVVIPWWVNQRARLEIPVHALAQPVQRSAFRMSTAPAGPRGEELHLEVAIDSRTVAIGGTLTGAIAAENLAHHRVRKLAVALVKIESVAQRTGPGAWCSATRTTPSQLIRRKKASRTHMTSKPGREKHGGCLPIGHAASGIEAASAWFGLTFPAGIVEAFSLAKNAAALFLGCHARLAERDSPFAVATALPSHPWSANRVCSCRHQRALALPTGRPPTASGRDPWPPAQWSFLRPRLVRPRRSSMASSPRPGAIRPRGAEGLGMRLTVV